MHTKALRILLAEDESLTLMDFASILSNLGHDVISQTTDGKTAVELADMFRPDLIIMDINMPMMDGISALEHINKNKMIPCIFITGYSDPRLISRANSAGAFGYLIKPVDSDDFRVTIEIAMARFSEFKQMKEELKSTQAALNDRKFVERAKGILMDKFDMKEAAAMVLLQKKSKERNKKLVEVAKSIIKADELLDM